MRLNTKNLKNKHSQIYKQQNVATSDHYNTEFHL